MANDHRFRMAGNIFSRALMSVFMDKKARAKYDAIQESKKAARTRKAAPMEAPNAQPATRGPDVAGDDNDVLPETLIHHAIEAAAQELERKKNLPPDRQALIEHALAVHDAKTEVLADLPDAQREKLMVMAMHAFGAEVEGKTAVQGKAKGTSKAATKRQRKKPAKK